MSENPELDKARQLASKEEMEKIIEKAMTRVRMGKKGLKEDEPKRIKRGRPAMINSTELNDEEDNLVDEDDDEL